MPLTNEEIDAFINTFKQSCDDDTTPTQTARDAVDELLSNLGDVETVENRASFREIYKLIWTEYHSQAIAMNWHKHVDAIIGKWFHTHRDMYGGYSSIEYSPSTIAWINQARNAETWNDALAAIPIIVTECWGI